MLFGKIAIRKGYVDKETVKECLELQRELKSKYEVNPKLGKLLVEKGHLTEEEVEKIAEIQADQFEQQRIPGYELKKKLGEGATGSVYKARQISMDRPVAIKILTDEVVEDDAYVKRFFREARSVAKLNHANIIKGIDVDSHEGLYYFVMEYAGGGNLQERLGPDETLDEETLFHVAIRISDALQHAYENGLIHRDIKPSNIILKKDGTPKLCDLGLAKPMESESSAITQTGVTIGTPYYISPEQTKGEDNVDIRSDIYSLGATLYRLGTGKVPFEGSTSTAVLTKHVTDELVPPKEVNPKINPALSNIIEKMMEKAPDDRYQEPAEVIEDLEKAKEGKRITTPGKTSGSRSKPSKPKRSTTHRTKSKSSSSSTWTGLIAVAVAAGLLFFVYTMLNQSNNPGSGPDGNGNSSRQGTVNPENGTKPTGSDSTTAGDTDTSSSDGNQNENDYVSILDKIKEIKERINNFSGDISEANKIRDKIKSLQQKNISPQDKLKLKRELKKHFHKTASDQIFQRLQETAADKDNPVDKLSVLNQFPSWLNGTEPYRKAENRKQEIRTSIKNQLQNARETIETKLEENPGEETFKESENIIEQSKKLVSKDRTPDLYKEWKGIKELVETKKDDYGDQLENRDKKKLKNLGFKNKLTESISKGKHIFDIPLTNLEKLITTTADKMKTNKHKNRVVQYRRDINLFKKYRSALRTGLQNWEKEGGIIEREKNNSKVSLKSISTNGKNWANVELNCKLKDLNRTIPVPLEEFSIDEHVKILEEYGNLTPEAYSAVGILLYWENPDTEEEEQLLKIAKYLEKGSKGGVARAKHYFDLLPKTVRDKNERKARALYAKMKEYFSTRNYQLAYGKGETLKGQYADTAYFKKFQSEIEKKMEEIINKIGYAGAHRDDVKRLFHGEITNINSDNTVHINYNFSEKDELKDWDFIWSDGRNMSASYNKKRKAVEINGLSKGGGGGNDVYGNKAVFEKQAKINVKMLTTNGESTGLMTMLMENDEREITRGYRVLLDHQSFPGRNNETRISVLDRYDGDGDFNPIVERPIPRKKLDLKKNTLFRLSMENRKNKVYVKYGGRTIFRGMDPKLDTENKRKKFLRGKVGIHAVWTNLIVTDVQIRGKLNRDWLKSALQRQDEED